MERRCTKDVTEQRNVTLDLTAENWELLLSAWTEAKRDAMTEPELPDELETLIDRHSLGAVLENMSSICYEKADHIRSNWQDEALATVWDRMARRIATQARAAEDYQLNG